MSRIIGDLSSLLRDVRDLASQAAGRARVASTLQRDVDAATDGVARLAGAPSLAELRRAGRPAPLDTYDAEPPALLYSNVHAGTRKFSVRGVQFPAGQSLDVNVEILTSAQPAALHLSFGNAFLNLSGAGLSAVPQARFVFELQGAHGTHEFSFGSGTLLSTIRDSINHFKTVTGVSATLSGAGGIRVSSLAHGEDEFVSVRVIDSAGARGSGIISYVPTNNHIVGPESIRVAWASAVVPIVDEGQDIRARINGVHAIGRGLEIDSLPGAGLDITVQFTQHRAQTLGSFRALTVTRPADGAEGASATAIPKRAGTARARPSAGFDALA